MELRIAQTGTTQPIRQRLRIRRPSVQSLILQLRDLRRHRIHILQQQAQGHADAVHILTIRVMRHNPGEGQHGFTRRTNPQAVTVVNPQRRVQPVRRHRRLSQTGTRKCRRIRIRPPLTNSSQRGTRGPIRHHNRTRRVADNVADLRQTSAFRLVEGRGAVNNTVRRITRRAVIVDTRNAHGIDDRQRDFPARRLLAGVPQTHGIRAAMVGQQTVAAIRDGRPRHELRTAHKTGRHRRQTRRRRRQGGHVVRIRSIGRVRNTDHVLRRGLPHRYEPTQPRNARQRAAENRDLLQARLRQDQARDSHQNDAVQTSAHQGGQLRELHQPIPAQHQIQQPAGESTGQGRSEHPRRRPHNFTAAQRPQGTMQQDRADDRTRDEAEPVGSR